MGAGDHNNGHVTTTLYLDFDELRIQKDYLKSSDMPEEFKEGLVSIVEAIQASAAEVHGHEFVYGSD